MDGTAVGYVVTVIPQPVAAGGGAAEVAEAVAVEVAEAAAVVDSSQAQDRKGLSALGPFSVPAIRTGCAFKATRRC
jgi:hypothetical protein